MVKIHIRDAEHWITVRPNGEEKGQPLLIEGSNGHYVVKGGAGGKLNGKTVTPKSMSKARKGTENESGTESGTAKPATTKNPAETPVETPVEKPAEKTAKKVDVEVTKSSNEFASYPYIVSCKNDQGLEVGMKFNEDEKKSGVLDAYKEWLAEHGNQLSKQMSAAHSQKTSGVDNFILHCDKDLYDQIATYGDPTGKISHEEARKELSWIGQEVQELRKRKAEPYRQAQEQRKAAHEKHVAEQKTWKRGAYEPQKTSKAAAEWAVKNNYATEANYGKLSPEVANASNESLARHINEFPALREHLPFIGSCQEMNKWRNQGRAEKYRIDLAERGYTPDQIEEYVKSHCKPSKVVKSWAFAAFAGGIGFNEKWGNPKATAEIQASLDRSLRTEFHPVGCDTVKSIYDHEFGHQLDFMLKASDDPDMVKLRRDLISRNATKSELSGYALEDKYEFIAEGWAEYLNNPNPRPVAKQIGDKIRSLYAAKFGKPTAAT